MSTMVTELVVPLAYSTLRERGSCYAQRLVEKCGLRRSKCVNVTIFGKLADQGNSRRSLTIAVSLVLISLVIAKIACGSALVIAVAVLLLDIRCTGNAGNQCCENIHS